MKKLRVVITILMLLLGVASQANAQDSSESSEYLVKAGFIYNFAKLVEWPATAFAQPDSPIVIGILGTDPFGPIIDRVLDGKKVNGRGLVVKRLKSLNDVKDCHIVFVTSSEVARSIEAIRLAKNMPVLTIGEIPGFAKHGGIINRRAFAEIPPRVEYDLTEKGQALLLLIENMREYGLRWL